MRIERVWGADGPSVCKDLLQSGEKSEFGLLGNDARVVGLTLIVLTVHRLNSIADKRLRSGGHTDLLAKRILTSRKGSSAKLRLWEGSWD